MAARWCCDDPTEGTLHNGCGDARVNGLEGTARTDAETEMAIALLEQARCEGRKRSREEEAAGAELLAAASDATPLAEVFAPLRAFALRDANAGGPELKLFDAMASPDRQLIKAGYFVAEGALVVQQLLRLPAAYRLVSILSTEAQLRKLAPDLRQAEERYRALEAMAGEATAGDGSAAAATGFKHSALSILAIARRPAAVHLPLERWLPTLRPAEGTVRPTLLVLDNVIKPENVGSLFRTALAFGCAGVLLGPGCADPLYRKSGSVAHAAAIGAGGAMLDAPLAVMVGAEYEGVGEAAAACADARVRIPMSGEMDATLDSLNVNVAAAIVLERVFSLNQGTAPPLGEI